MNPAAAQSGAPAHDWATWRPTAQATRIAPSEAPTIDGDVSDPIWQKASSIDEFYQLEPDTGKPASERTVVHVLYDDTTIYVAFYAYDSQPDQVIGSIKTRDGNADSDDSVRVYLDPSMSRRNGYAFLINPLGMRVDALIQNNTDYLVEWNTIWTAHARKVADGWTAEFAIPFRSISYDAARTDWGFDLSRYVRRKNERIRWSSVSATIPGLDISRSGTLTGIHDLKRGIGLELQLYGSVRYKRDWHDGTDGDIKLVESGNAYYRITPALTGTLTVNPDFSDTPLDNRQINTTRFSLFLPETRDFFLQDAASFEFGGQAFVEAPNGRAFFSRTVGQVEGQGVPIIAGGKVSGEYGGFNIGGFSALTGDTLNIDKQLLSVARVTHPILDESKIGFIVTNGNPTGSSQNTLVGGDFQYRNSNVFDGRVLQADFSYQHSFDDVLGNGSLLGAGISYPNEPWGGSFRFKQIDDNFFPALGFVNRAGIRSYHTAGLYRPRFQNSWLRWMEFGSSNDTVTGLDNKLQSMDQNFWIGGLTSDQGDAVFLNAHTDYEDVPEAFSLGGHATVAPGTYHWEVFEPYIETSLGRSWQIIADIYCCDFYDGHIFNADMILSWRPNSTFEIIPRYIVALIDLPSGSVDIHVAQLTTNVNFTPEMQLSAQAQYDNQSKNFGLSVRYRWEYEPGNQIFIALGESAIVDGHFWRPQYRSQTSQLAFRMGKTLWFSFCDRS